MPAKTDRRSRRGFERLRYRDRAGTGICRHGKFAQVAGALSAGPGTGTDERSTMVGAAECGAVHYGLLRELILQFDHS